MKKVLLASLICLSLSSCSCDNRNSQHQQKTSTCPDDTDSADWVITSKVKASIVSDSVVSSSAKFVSVTTTDGVVTLTGTVNSRDDRDRIVKLAKQVQGVKRVDNQMTAS